MPDLNLIMDGDGVWPDLSSRRVAKPANVQAAMLPGVMESGRTGITFRLNMPDGSVVLYETSLRILEATVKAFRVREEFLGIVDDGKD